MLSKKLLFKSQRDAIRSWLKDNCEEGYRFDTHSMAVYFRSYTDALAFKLTFQDIIISEDPLQERCTFYFLEDRAD
jgi:hypothetical protein